jgi:hypothetical protein
MNNKLPPILDVKTAFEFEHNIKILWNGSATFNVFNDGKEVNVFTDYTCKTAEQAQNPILQKRHYEFIADILKEINEHKLYTIDYKKSEDNETDVLEEANSLLIKIFADKFAESNPVFDKKKFLDRIGVK